MTKKNAKKTAARARQKVLGGKYQHHLREAQRTTHDNEHCTSSVQRCTKCQDTGCPANESRGPNTYEIVVPDGSRVEIVPGRQLPWFASERQEKRGLK